jgi:hypothetical protein
MKHGTNTLNVALIFYLNWIERDWARESERKRNSQRDRKRGREKDIASEREGERERQWMYSDQFDVNLMVQKCAFLSKTRTFLSNLKLLNSSVDVLGGSLMGHVWRRFPQGRLRLRLELSSHPHTALTASRARWSQQPWSSLSDLMLSEYSHYRCAVCVACNYEYRFIQSMCSAPGRPEWSKAVAFDLVSLSVRRRRTLTHRSSEEYTFQ